MGAAQNEMMQKYGVPNHDYIVKNCIMWTPKDDGFSWFPEHTFLINKNFKDMLFDLFWNIYYNKLHTEIKTFDGCYNDRMVRGHTDTLSIHAWAGAIDLNAALNPMVEKPLEQITEADRLGNWSPRFVQLIRESPVTFGGDFHTRPDPMHLAMVDG